MYVCLASDQSHPSNAVTRGGRPAWRWSIDAAAYPLEPDRGRGVPPSERFASEGGGAEPERPQPQVRPLPDREPGQTYKKGGGGKGGVF